ncbi:MAG: hypothetical protein WCX69_03025 [Candidatus Paceibacterota bacterium]
MLRQDQFLDNRDQPDNLDSARDKGLDQQTEKPSEIDAEMMLALSSKSIPLWKRMTDRGKKIAFNTFESIKNKIPKKDDVCAKAQIYVNERYMGRHERISLHWGQKVEEANIAIEAMKDSVEIIQGQIDEFKKAGMPGVTELEKNKRNIQIQIRTELVKIDKMQTKYNAEQQRMIDGANERDRIVNEMIRRSNDIKEPLERDIDELLKTKDKVKAAFDLLESKQAATKERLEDLQAKKTALENALALSNKPHWAIKRSSAVKSLEKMIAAEYKKMEKQKADLHRKSGQIDQLITEADRKAAPTRDRVAYYARKKEARPISNENIPERDRKDKITEPEEIKIHRG